MTKRDFYIRLLMQKSIECNINNFIRFCYKSSNKPVKYKQESMYAVKWLILKPVNRL